MTKLMFSTFSGIAMQTHAESDVIIKLDILYLLDAILNDIRNWSFVIKVDDSSFINAEISSTIPRKCRFKRNPDSDNSVRADSRRYHSHSKSLNWEILKCAFSCLQTQLVRATEILYCVDKIHRPDQAILYSLHHMRSYRSPRVDFHFAIKIKISGHSFIGFYEYSRTFRLLSLVWLPDQALHATQCILGFTFIRNGQASNY